MKVYEREPGYGEAEVVAEYDEEAEEFVSGRERVVGVLGFEPTAEEMWESLDGPRFFVGEGAGEETKSRPSVLEALRRVLG